MNRIPRLVPLLLLAAGCFPAGSRSAPVVDEAGASGRPTVLLRGEGERRMMRGTRPLWIVADSATVGSRTLMAGYEEVAPGDSGRLHMHLQQEEILFVHRGTMEITLAGTTYRAGPGATVFIPRRTPIIFRTVGADTAGFFFVFDRPGFEKCLRALSSPPGEAWVAPSPAEMDRVAHECHMGRPNP